MHDWVGCILALIEEKKVRKKSRSNFFRNIHRLIYKYDSKQKYFWLHKSEM